jgi:2-keto-4-pentenoate hydratase/2-oxohepta-3-ene-1,7-dioic acid hydratase in catechol pathway
VTVRIVQFEREGIAAVGRMQDEHTVVPLRVPSGMSCDQAVISLALGDVTADESAAAIDLGGVTLTAPVRQPASIRDFMLFEKHLANSLRPYGKKVPAAWYEQPAFYFTNPHTVLGPGALLSPPPSDQLDYELELAVVIGRRLRNPSREQALDAIAGFSLFNDFSLRDVQAAERPIGLGPGKSKDFASALGPYLVTCDEIPGDRARPELTLTASVNGERWSEGSADTMYFDLAEAIMHAARDSWVLPGDVVATGTVPTGCVLELLALNEAGPHRWLLPGDEVTLGADLLGSLVTTVVAPGQEPPFSTEGESHGL